MKQKWLVTMVLVALAIGQAATIQAQQRTITPEERAQRERELQEELQQPRPIDALNSVWIEELTWLEVRDALAAGMTTAIITTGGIEPNGPYLATGKHNYVLQGACERIARKLGNALCAPIIKLVPEGNIDEPSGHMRYPGTISLREETFRSVLTDVASSLKAHGFVNIIFIGDSGGNQRGMAAVANALNEKWGQATAHHILEFYRLKQDSPGWMEEQFGIVQVDEGLHDNFIITSEIMVTDPTAVRYDQRVRAGKATINGVSIEPKETTIELGEKLLGFRVDRTVEAIRGAIAGTSATNGR